MQDTEEAQWKSSFRSLESKYCFVGTRVRAHQTFSNVLDGSRHASSDGLNLDFPCPILDMFSRASLPSHSEAPPPCTSKLATGLSPGVPLNLYSCSRAQKDQMTDLRSFSRSYSSVSMNCQILLKCFSS